MKCMAIGDMGRGSQGQYEVAKAMKQNYKKHKIQFVLGLGDNIYENGATSVNDPQFITKFETPYKLLPNDPWYMCLGNHDYGYTEDSLGFLDNSKTQIDYSRKSKKWTMPSSYYSFVKGNTQFFYLDTNLDRLSSSQIKAQLKFMKHKLDTSKKRWKVVVGHHTWRSVASHGNSELDGFETFMNKLFKDTKPHVYMGGHDHCQSLIVKDKTSIVVSGSGSDEYYINEPITLSNMKDCRLDYFSPSQGYVILDMKPNELILEFYNKHNFKEYKHIIR